MEEGGRVKVEMLTRKELGSPMNSQGLGDAVSKQLLQQVKADGYGDAVCDALQKHLSCLPTRYAVSIDPSRHMDVLMHMTLLSEARTLTAERAAGSQGGRVMPVVNVRKVSLANWAESGHLDLQQREDESESSRAPLASSSGRTPPIPYPSRRGPDIPNPKAAGLNTFAGLALPKPAFGSNVNLAALAGTSPARIAPLSAAAMRGSTPGSPSTSRSLGEGGGGAGGEVVGLPPAGFFVPRVPGGLVSPLTSPAGGGLGFEMGGEGDGLPRPAFGSLPNLSILDVEERELLGDPPVGYEVTVAASDRHALLQSLTTALSDCALELNIREAHTFSTTDGMALQVYVVDGWCGEDPEELRVAVLAAVRGTVAAAAALRQLRRQGAAEAAGAGAAAGGSMTGAAAGGSMTGAGGGAVVVSAGHTRPDPPRTWSGRAMSRDMREALMAELKVSVEKLGYEDWTVDFTKLELSERLGGGSSGRLYRGRYQGQDVAVKMIVLDDDGGIGTQSGTLRPAPAEELLQMFQQEVSIMRMVRHKNVVQFIGACSIWPRLFIVTELMAGGSVRDMLQNRGGLDIPAALRVLRDAARGVDFLHRRSILHRDLKAANLLIDEHEVVKVCDFGVARQKPCMIVADTVSGEAIMTAETGTYRWMAPEVLEHRPYDHKVDVYSFGITIWEVLTGEVPYSGLTPLQAAIGVVQRHLRPVVPPSCPPRLAALMQQCWHSDPAQRPEFKEILVSLEEQLKAAVAAAAQSTAPARKGFFSRGSFK